MAIIKPFNGILPSRDKVSLVVSKSLDNYKPGELNYILSENPFSFLQIIKPKVTEIERLKSGSPELLKRIKSTFKKFIADKIIIRDAKPALYIYRQEKNGFFYTGLIGGASTEDYRQGVIKTHEQTLKDKEEKLKDYLEICDFNAEPVCLSYPNDVIIDDLIESITNAQEPYFDFTSTDRTRHKVWVINDLSLLDIIQEQFKKIPAIYIADGHHRSASSVLLSDQKPAGKNKDRAIDYFMGIYFPESQLKIFDFNRIVKDIAGLCVDEFLQKISAKFTIEKKGNNIHRPQNIHQFSLYIENCWYALSAKPGTYHSNDPVGSLDVSILSEHILAPVLGITDLRTDKRIGFVPGIKGMEEIKARVDSGKMKAGFGLYPVQMSQLKLISDTGNIMPPKSTWIEPKLRSGLVIYSLT